MTERTFEVDGVEWVARDAGSGAVGWGSRSTAAVSAVHFYRPGEERPRYEALVGRSRLAHLYESELVELLRTAVPVPPAS